MALAYTVTAAPASGEDVAERLLVVTVDGAETARMRFPSIKTDLGEVIAGDGQSVTLTLIEQTYAGDDGDPVVLTFTAGGGVEPSPAGEIEVKLARIGV